MAIRLERASYRYAGVGRDVLHEIDLVIEPGRVMGVVGGNEAGKSTLCLVAGALAPSTIGGRLTGSVTIDGAETRTMRPHEAAQRCGMLFQNPATQLTLTAATVFEEIAFGPRNIGCEADDVVARVTWAMATVGIDGLAPRDPARVSGGQAQLVALASVLALRPRYLVLDEPTSQLDPIGTRLVGGALFRLARETDTGILVVEHKTDLLARIADDVVVLADGRVVNRGDAADLLADPILTSLGVSLTSRARLQFAAAEAGVTLDAALLEEVDLEASEPVAVAESRGAAT